MSYQRTIDLDSGDSLARLARWIRPGATVLELGPATGYFTEWLQGRGCTVDVVEIDPEAARRAEPFARRVVVADLDADGWDDALGAARYDCVVCADVLEHLRHGQRLLERLRTRLAPEGELLLSVPNVAHAAIIMELLDDRFEYGGEGLLDSTHLRLYTWRSLAAVLAAAGFEVRAWDATEKTPWESEFRARTEALRPELRAPSVRGPGTTPISGWCGRCPAAADWQRPRRRSRVASRFRCASSAPPAPTNCRWIAPRPCSFPRTAIPGTASSASRQARRRFAYSSPTASG
ncbi:MAG: class I SAM-dependent methyltransferase [Betaproteobacteria bacterium]|nr:class I SAM-dependent methyltransferase [Betaproteobacteria bacterium]